MAESIFIASNSTKQGEIIFKLAQASYKAGRDSRGTQERVIVHHPEGDEARVDAVVFATDPDAKRS